MTMLYLLVLGLSGQPKPFSEADALWMLGEMLIECTAFWAMAIIGTLRQRDGVAGFEV